MGTSPLNTAVFPAANAVTGPVLQGQLCALAGAAGTWVSLQNQFDASALPYGQASPGSADTVDGESNFGPWQVQGSDDFWHFVAPTPLQILGAIYRSGTNEPHFADAGSRHRSTTRDHGCHGRGALLLLDGLAARWFVAFKCWHNLWLDFCRRNSHHHDVTIHRRISRASRLQIALPIGFSLAEIFVNSPATFEPNTPNAETVTITAVNPAIPAITATFTRSHAQGVTVTLIQNYGSGAGTYQFSVTVTDAKNTTVSAQLSITATF